jgi:hypothetical protein
VYCRTLQNFTDASVFEKNLTSQSQDFTCNFLTCYLPPRLLLLVHALGLYITLTHLRESASCRIDHHFGYVPLEITFLCCNFLLPAQLNVWQSFIEVRNFIAWKLEERTPGELSRSVLLYFNHPGSSQCLII